MFDRLEVALIFIDLNNKLKKKWRKQEYPEKTLDDEL